MAVAICVALMIGMIIGRFFRHPENDCPAVELGYECQYDRCDHRESELYRAKMNMALQREERKDQNYWRGDK